MTTIRVPTQQQKFKLNLGYYNRCEIVATFHSYYGIDDVYKYLDEIGQIDFMNDRGESYLRVCDDCNMGGHQDDMKWIESESIEVCESCIDEHYRFCEHNEEYYDTRLTSFYRVQDLDSTISEHACESGDYFTCDCCGEVFTLNSYGEDGHCQSCEESNDENDNSRHIHDYSYKPEAVFFGHGRHFGVELEVEHSDSTSDVAESVHYQLSSNGLTKKFYMKNDSSLDDGIEYVTHPMTMREHIGFWPELIGAIKNADSGAKSHDVSTCGLHIHVGRKSLDEATISRIAVFMMVCSKNLEIFARRRNNNYAQFVRDEKAKDVKKATKEKGRYAALNLSPKETIEFRFFKGTLKVETILASIELIDCMITFCKNKHALNTICNQDAFWLRFLNMTKNSRSENLNNYLESRGVLKITSIKAQKEKQKIVVKAIQLEQAENMEIPF